MAAKNNRFSVNHYRTGYSLYLSITHLLRTAAADGANDTVFFCHAVFVYNRSLQLVSLSLAYRISSFLILFLFLLLFLLYFQASKNLLPIPVLYPTGGSSFLILYYRFLKFFLIFSESSVRPLPN